MTAAAIVITISCVSIGISTWSMLDTYRRYQWLRWKVTRMAILGARTAISYYRATGITETFPNVFSGSYKRRYAQAYVRTLQAKEAQ